LFAAAWLTRLRRPCERRMRWRPDRPTRNALRALSTNVATTFLLTRQVLEAFSEKEQAIGSGLGRGSLGHRPILGRSCAQFADRQLIGHEGAHPPVCSRRRSWNCPSKAYGRVSAVPGWPLCQVREIGDGRSLHNPNLRDGFCLELADDLAAIQGYLNCPEALRHSHCAVGVHWGYMIGVSLRDKMI
jgi:hypothetical protein